MKKIRALSLVIVCLLLFTACSSAKGETAMSPGVNDFGGKTEAAVDKDIYYDAPSMDIMPEEPGASMDTSTVSSASTDSLLSDRKLIKNGTFTLETLEYDKTITAIEQLAVSSGGYVQDSTVRGTGAVSYGYSYQLRYAKYVIRIPADSFGSFEASLSQCGSILSRNVNVNEITDYYYDTDARLKSLQAQESQLLALLEKADYLDAIIQLQEELGNVRYEIESLQGTLRRLDNQIAFSTITINVNEVSEPTVVTVAPKTLGERISYTFSSTWYSLTESVKDFIVFFLGNIIVIAIWIVIIVAAVLIIRYSIERRRKNALKAKSEETKD